MPLEKKKAGRNRKQGRFTPAPKQYRVRPFAPAPKQRRKNRIVPAQNKHRRRKRLFPVPKHRRRYPVSVRKQHHRRFVCGQNYYLDLTAPAQKQPCFTQKQNQGKPVPAQNKHRRRKRPVSAYLGLGGNVGDSRSYLRRAIALLAKHPAIKVGRLSPFLKTRPVGYLEQADFLNGVVQIATTLTPRKLLAVAQAIENKLGRLRTIRWGPRTIDIDILLYGDLVLKTADLTIPHPRMLERAFVLKPLAMIAPGLRIPGCKATVYTLAQKLRHNP